MNWRDSYPDLLRFRHYTRDGWTVVEDVKGRASAIKRSGGPLAVARPGEASLSHACYWGPHCVALVSGYTGNRSPRAVYLDSGATRVVNGLDCAA